LVRIVLNRNGGDKVKKIGKKKIKLFCREHKSRYGINMDDGGFEGSFGPMHSLEKSYPPRKIDE